MDSFQVCGGAAAAVNMFLLFISPSKNKAKTGGICVANHTSPIDVIILQNDNCYALVRDLPPAQTCHHL